MAEMIREFLQRGGPVMPWIFVSSLLMWVLILDSYRHVRIHGEVTIERLRMESSRLRQLPPRIARRLGQQRIADITVAARRHVPLIRTLVQALPLLGLLGTVTGLIHCFEGIAVFGENNRSAIASGISEALVATLAGLVTALSGLLFGIKLEARVAALRILAEQAAVSGA